MSLRLCHRNGFGTRGSATGDRLSASTGWLRPGSSDRYNIYSRPAGRDCGSVGIRSLRPRTRSCGGGGLPRVASLEALRRYADRITVFCQKGHISVPRSHERFFAYLEQSIVEVPAPHDLFTFQPKVWVLRYLPHDGKSAPLYRCICLSRNLTYDRSWDTVLVLDGAVGGEQEDTPGP